MMTIQFSELLVSEQLTLFVSWGVLEATVK